MSSSWSTWVERFMADKTNMEKCGIYGKTNGEPWAVSEGMAATPEEVQHISSNYDDNDIFFTEGCRIEGKKFNFLRKVEEVLVFKKSKEDQNEATGSEKADMPFLLAMNTIQACLIGISKGDEESKFKAIRLMETIAEELKKTKY
ncbi:profilin-1-like [Saccostrea cucullata]|uniref:profilin-1-like n=1 Tax=Saccostrea cuccullata TaxID=36930 RepID=UPI002ED680C9